MIDWKSMSDEELYEIADAANSQISMRRIAAKKEAWEDFVKAFRKYIYEFGGISIINHGEEDYFFSNIINKPDFEAMCSEPGIINTDLEHDEDEDY